LIERQAADHIIADSADQRAALVPIASISEDDTKRGAKA
jgi:hypothetical protein